MSKGEVAKHIQPEDKKIISSSGIDVAEDMRSATFLQKDSSVVFSRSLSDDVEVMNIHDALKELPDIKNYYGQAFKSLNRDYPADTEGGYFIRVKRGKTVELPIQACLFLKSRGFQQKVHNIIVVEEGARVYLITGCSASEAAHESSHLGISEFFVKKGAYLNFTMIHSWREDVSVKPMSISLVDEGASFISNYISLRPVKEITMYPTSVLNGADARARYNSLILSHPDSFHDIGSRVILKGRNTQAEIIARSVSLGGRVINRGHIKAENKDVTGHLECRGLILSEQGIIHAVPEMETNYRDVNLSHEAAIGKISKDEIEYLCSRGFSSEEAQSIIVRGFMDVDILGLPDMLRQEIDKLENDMLKGSF